MRTKHFKIVSQQLHPKFHHNFIIARAEFFFLIGTRDVMKNLDYTPYSQKILWGIKFGGVAVYITTAKLKSAKISYSHIYNYTYGDPVPNRQI